MPLSYTPEAPQILDAFEKLDLFPSLRQCGPSAAIDALRHVIPFTYISVSGLDIEGFHYGDGRSLDTTAPPAYVETYVAEELFRVDPLYLRLSEVKRTVTSSEAYDFYTRPKRMQELEKVFGIGSRLAVPVMRSDVIYGCVTISRDAPFSESEQKFVAHYSKWLHAYWTHPFMTRFARRELHLTEGELVCIKYASRGLTTQEISTITGYMPMTVNSYLRDATKKLRAENRTHAIAESLRRNIIE